MGLSHLSHLGLPPPLVPQVSHSRPSLALQESKLGWGLLSTQECHIPSFVP